MGRTVGIDLGTTNAVVATVAGGRPEVVPSADGSRVTPAVVAVTTQGEWLVGGAARRQAVLNPDGTVAAATRFIGRRYPDTGDERRLVPYDVVPGPDGSVRFPLQGRRYAPEEISARVLEKLAGDAGRAAGERVTGAVIAVPAYFDGARRRATGEAGRLAGLAVPRLVDEPVAAALAYGLDRGGRTTVLVFDLGGGTLDVTVLDAGDGVVEIRATAGDARLGGDDFDRRIVDLLADGFEREEGIDLRRDPRARQRLVDAAEKAKVELSSVTRTTVSLPFVATTGADAKHLHTTLQRSTFEHLTADLVERVAGPVRRAMADARVADTDLDAVLLVGGATRMPAVRALVRRLTYREPDMSVDPDEVVALGAAVSAALPSNVTAGAPARSGPYHGRVGVGRGAADRAPG